MQRLDRRQKHETFHESILIQKNIIDEKNFTYRIILQIITSYLTRHKNILDIGCGAGTICLYLAGKGYDVLGIDISQNAINACKRSAKLISLRDVKFQRMNFPDEILNGKFDYIICSEVLEHLDNDDLALKRIYSLLNKDGIAIISTPSKNAPLYRLGLADEFDNRVGHLRRYTLQDLISKCKKVGFTILETRKTEGVLRNFLFINPIASKLVRFINFFVSDVVTFLDNISLQLFGESQIFVIVKKI